MIIYQNKQTNIRLDLHLEDHKKHFSLYDDNRIPLSLKIELDEDGTPKEYVNFKGQLFHFVFGSNGLLFLIYRTNWGRYKVDPNTDAAFQLPEAIVHGYLLWRHKDANKTPTP